MLPFCARAQTCDPHMIINRGKFAQNGRAGYLLKPAYLLPSASPALPVDANAKATFADNSNRVRARASLRDRAKKTQKKWEIIF